MDGVRLVRPRNGPRTRRHPACSGSRPFNTGGLWAGVAHTQPGAVSGWHHHGEYESTIYVLTGSMRMEFGPDGGDSLDAVPGDFIYIAPHEIHREGNPSGEPGSAVVVRAGQGEPVFNVDGPGAG